MIQVTKKPRHIVARELVNEHRKSIKTKADWPRSNKQLFALKEKIAMLRLMKQIHEEIEAVNEHLKLTTTKPKRSQSLSSLKEKNKLLRLRKQIHEEIRQGGYVIDEAFSGADKYIKFIPRGKHYNHFAVNDLIKIIKTTLPSILLKKPTLKVNAEYCIDMYLAHNPKVTQTRFLKAVSQIVTRATDLEELAKEFFKRISRNFEIHNSFGSGWVFNKVNYIQLSVQEFTMQTGASYKPLPGKIIATRSCINVKNDDNKCVLWALLSACFPEQDNADRVSKYKPYKCRINMSGIDFPTPVKQIPKIERQNPTLFPSGINVFSLDDQLRVFPYLISPASKHCTDGTVVNLLYHNEHFVWIKNLSRLMSSKMSGYDRQMFFCYSCLCGFRSQQELIEHNKYCFEVKAITVPKEPKNICEFKKYERTKKLPLVFIGDFESFVFPVDNSMCICNEQPCRCNIKMLSTHKHEPASYQINMICTNEKLSKLSPCYRKNNHNDESPEVHLLKYLFEQQRIIESLLCFQQERYITLNSFKCATKCYMCKKEFTDNNPKVPFYNVITDEYVGVVHQRCRSFQKFYPVVFHNLRGYDGHFILRALGDPEIAKYCTDNNITLKCIPNNTERLMSITIGKFRFIDSLQFMNASLEQLAKNLTSYPITEKHFSADKIKHITVKYFTGPERFTETSLPSIDKFYSSLNDTNISEEEYNRAIATWNLFGCNNFGDYHDIYLTVDVLLLSDIFEEFRNTSMKVYGLDPAHYYSAPGLSWDALLKSTSIKLELLTDVDMYFVYRESDQRWNKRNREKTFHREQ